jgi:hypothetical protein
MSFFFTYPHEIRTSDIRFMKHDLQSIKLPFGDKNYILCDNLLGE